MREVGRQGGPAYHDASLPRGKEAGERPSSPDRLGKGISSSPSATGTQPGVCLGHLLLAPSHPPLGNFWAFPPCPGPLGLLLVFPAITLLKSNSHRTTHPFKVYDSVAFRIFIGPCDHHHNQFPSIFFTPKRSPALSHPPQSLPVPPPLPGPPWATTHPFLSL